MIEEEENIRQVIVVQRNQSEPLRQEQNGSHRERYELRQKKKQLILEPLFQVLVQGGRKTRTNHYQFNEAAHSSHHHRHKRSISTPRYVEALLVADSSMVAFHQDGDVETYLLTIMNMVSSLYKDPAIGNLIKIIVVRIILLEEAESHPDFNVTHIAERYLTNFCR